jgi:hypothetical protein
MITVVGPGAGSSAIGATTGSQCVIGEGGGSAGAITALVFNSVYYATHATTFTDYWTIVTSTGGIGGPIGFGTSSPNPSEVYGNPSGGKYADWYILAYGGSGANFTGAATTSAVRRAAGQGNTINTANVGGATFSPLVYSYQRKTGSLYSYITGLTFGLQAESICPMAGLITPYLPNYNNSGDVVMLSTGTLSSQSDGPGSGGRAIVRIGTGSASAGLAGSFGLVHISWWG